MVARVRPIHGSSRRLGGACGRRDAAAWLAPGMVRTQGALLALAPPGRAATRVPRVLHFISVLRMQAARCRGSAGSFLPHPYAPSGPGRGGLEGEGT